jgi:hypothetical protein
VEDPVQDGVERREEKDTVAQISIEIPKGRDIHILYIQSSCRSTEEEGPCNIEVTQAFACTHSCYPNAAVCYIAIMPISGGIASAVTGTRRRSVPAGAASKTTPP